MGVLTRISDTIGFTSAQAREDRQARSMLESHVRTLASEYHQLRESISVADLRPVMPWERLYDGDRLLFPSGQTTDRARGKNWPILKDEQDLRQMRSFSRLLCETNSYAIGFRDHVRNFVVGPGFTWQVVLAGQQTGATSTGMVDKDGDGKPDVDPDVEACQQVLDEFCRLNHWGDSGEALVNQDLDQPVCAPVNRERETYERAMEDGEAVLRLFRGESDTRGIPHLRPVEPECLTCPPNHDQNGNWSFGILTEEDDVEKQIAFHFADPLRPGEIGDIVPAGHVLHFKLNSKSTVKRGVPDFWPIEDELTGSRTLVRNMVKVSGILSAIAYIRQHAPTTLPEQVRQLIDKSSIQPPLGANPMGVRAPLGQAGPDATRYMSVHQAGLIIDISNQLQYQPGPVNGGVPGFLQAQQAALRCVGLRWGCPEYFSGDASNANFASTLVAGGPFERGTTARQSDYKLYQQTLAIRVLLFAVESGRLRRQQVARVAVRVTCPPVAIANRNEDTQRRKTLFDSKILDPQTWITEEGYDPNVVAANIKAWNQQFPNDAGGGMFGAGGDDGGDDGTGGGDDFASLFGESFGWLEEGGFTGQRTDKLGRKTNWVDGKRVASKGGKSADTSKPQAEPKPKKPTAAQQKKVARETAVTAARELIADPSKLTPDHLPGLAANLGHLSQSELKETAKRLSAKVGGTKAALAERIVAALKLQKELTTDPRTKAIASVLERHRNGDIDLAEAVEAIKEQQSSTAPAPKAEPQPAAKPDAPKPTPKKAEPDQPDPARPEETGFTGVAGNGVRYVDGVPQKKQDESSNVVGKGKSEAIQGVRHKGHEWIAQAFADSNLMDGVDGYPQQIPDSLIDQIDQLAETDAGRTAAVSAVHGTGDMNHTMRFPRDEIIAEAKYEVESGMYPSVEEYWKANAKDVEASIHRSEKRNAAFVANMREIGNDDLADWYEHYHPLFAASMRKLTGVGASKTPAPTPIDRTNDALDDFFNEPDEAPKPSEPEGDLRDNALLDDLFGEPAEPEPAPAPKAEPKTKMEPEDTDEFVNLYSKLRDDRSLNSSELRAAFQPFLDRYSKAPKEELIAAVRKMGFSTMDGSREKILKTLHTNLDTLKRSQQRADRETGTAEPKTAPAPKKAALPPEKRGIHGGHVLKLRDPETTAIGNQILDSGADEAITKAYNQLTKFREFSSGIVDFPSLFTHVQSTNPEFTDYQLKLAILAMDATGAGGMHDMNEVNSFSKEDKAYTIEDANSYHIPYYLSVSPKASAGGSRPEIDLAKLRALRGK